MPATIPARISGWFVAGAFLLVTTVLAAFVGLVGRPISLPFLTGPDWLDGWFQGDAGWYFGIATYGYSFQPGTQSAVAFFPTYPMSVRGLGGLLGGDFQIAGQGLAVAAGLLSVVLFARWASTRLPRRSVVLATAALMLYPYSFFLYGAMYADSLFLLCALGAFLLLERRWYLAAGLVGALATAGRPVGVAVAVGLVVRTLELLAQDRRARLEPDAPLTSRTGWRDLVVAVRDVRIRHVGVLASAAGLVGWCVYLALKFGHPLAWVEVESAPGWDQGVGPRTWFKIAYGGQLLHGERRVAMLLTLQAVACLCAVLLMRRVWQRFGWGYAAYAAVVLLIPIIGTKDFMGTGRYVLVAFPVMAAAGDFLAGVKYRWIRVAVLCTCAALLLVLTYLYTRTVAVS